MTPCCHHRCGTREGKCIDTSRCLLSNFGSIVRRPDIQDVRSPHAELETRCYTKVKLRNSFLVCLPCHSCSVITAWFECLDTAWRGMLKRWVQYPLPSV